MSRAAARSGGSGFRPELQMLRAVAVGGVLVYHLWPTLLPGGYTGVDVFFVISGLLITSHLLRDAQGPDGVRPLRFWAARVRRLLPLAFLVLACAGAATLLLLPQSRWRASFAEIAASGLYVENWRLAHASVDYLAAAEPPSPVQHFWSLSVEEQFYLLWPLLLLAAAWAARRGADGAGCSRRIRFAAAGTIGVVAVCSFLFSLYETVHAPAIAYFSTPVRAWEFAAGALAACAGGRLPAAREGRTARGLGAAASWAGIGLILAGMLLLPEGVPFPGTAALLPVAGALLFMLGGMPDTPFAPAALARLRPVRFLGDVSYGIYLWHWPIIVLLPFALGREPGDAERVLVVLASVALAAVTTRLVEAPFRFGAFWRGPPVRSFAMGAAGMVLVCGTAVTAVVAIDWRNERALLEQEAAMAEQMRIAEERTGTVLAQLAAGIPEPQADFPAAEAGARLLPVPLGRAADFAQMYDCFDLERREARSCHYGDPDSDVRLAIVGNSHAAHLLPGLIRAVERNGWSLTTLVGAGCEVVSSAECVGGEQAMATLLGGGFDAVLLTGYRHEPPDPGELRDSWRLLLERGVPLVAVVDTPFNPQEAHDCIDATEADAARAAACSVPRRQVVDERPDHVRETAGELGVPVIDPLPLLCDHELCRSAIGTVLVYQDTPVSHITRTMSLTLAPLFEGRLRTVLGL